MAFMSARAQATRNGKRPYSIEEDRLIVEGLEDGLTASQIEDELAAHGYTRTVLSLQYRIGALRKASKKFDTLEEYHGITVARPAPKKPAAPPQEVDELAAELAALEDEEDEEDEVEAVVYGE